MSAAPCVSAAEHAARASAAARPVRQLHLLQQPCPLLPERPATLVSVQLPSSHAMNTHELPRPSQARTARPATRTGHAPAPTVHLCTPLPAPQGSLPCLRRGSAPCRGQAPRRSAARPPQRCASHPSRAAKPRAPPNLARCRMVPEATWEPVWTYSAGLRAVHRVASPHAPPAVPLYGDSWPLSVRFMALSEPDRGDLSGLRGNSRDLPGRGTDTC